MKSTDPKLRRVLLKPLVRRRVLPAQDAKIEKSLRDLEERAFASASLPELVAAYKSTRTEEPKDWWKDAESAKLFIRLAAALYLCRKISFQEYVFFVAHAAEDVHDARIQAGFYPELTQFSSSLREIELAHGLNDGEFWSIDEAPSDYQTVSANWSDNASKRFAETLVELEGQTVAVLFQKDEKEYKKMRERGRRATHHKGDLVHAVEDTIKRYEREASAAACAKAYIAAVTMLGASMEGLLLLRCLSSPKKAARFARTLPAKKRPSDPSSPAQWSFDTLIHVCLAAGWLPAINTSTIVVRPDGLAHLLRQMRNYVHPGRVGVDRPWIEAERRDFEDAQTIYTTLFRTVFKSSLLRKYSERNDDDAA